MSLIKKNTILIIVFVFIKSVYGSEVLPNPVYGDQVVPNYEKSDDQKRIPGDNVLPHIDMRKEPILQKILEKADSELVKLVDEFHKKDDENKKDDETNNSIVEEFPIPSRVISKKVKIDKKKFSLEDSIDSKQPPSNFSSNNAHVFIENTRFIHKLAGVPTITLPSNSTAFATIVAGLKVRPGKSMRLPVKVDYAFLGPNSAVVEMTGCESYVTVTADLNVSRLYGEMGNLSCKAPRGETFNILFRAHLIDQSDNYVGIEGTTVLNGKFAAGIMSFLSDGTAAFGKAMAASQVTTKVQTSSEGPAVSGANVTGDQSTYIAGQTIAAATGRFLNWWVDFYQDLQPTVEVASGRKIFLLTDGEFQIPKMFFTEEIDSKSISRLNTGKSLMQRVDEK